MYQCLFFKIDALVSVTRKQKSFNKDIGAKKNIFFLKSTFSEKNPSEGDSCFLFFYNVDQSDFLQNKITILTLRNG